MQQATELHGRDFDSFSEQKVRSSVDDLAPGKDRMMSPRRLLYDACLR
jgi:hypothetical protein